MVLPEGFALPPWYLLAPTLIVLAGAVTFLWSLDPPVTDRTVVAFTPWIMFGSVLHVLYRLEVFPESVAIMFASPGVYLVTALIIVIIWTLGILLHAAGFQRTNERILGITGTGFFIVFAMFTLITGVQVGEIGLFWSVISVVAAAIITALAWLALAILVTDVAAITSASGVVVVVGHTLDGVSTAIGYDALDAHEEVPLSRLILEFSEGLPTAEYLGAGWLFVLVKVVLALVVLGLFKEYVKESPRQARLLLAFIAAVGLGPGVHNVLLFAVG